MSRERYTLRMPPIVTTLRSPPTPGGDIQDAAGAALEAGFDGLVLEQPLHEADAAQLLGYLPRGAVRAVALFAPLPKAVRRGQRSPFDAAALGRSDRRDAERQALATLEFADRLGGAAVRVPRVELDLPRVREEWDRSRSRRAIDERALARWRSDRSHEAEARLDALLRLLDALLSHAERYGIRIVLTPTASLLEIPDRAAVARCLAEFGGAPLDVWPDTAHRALELALAPAASSDTSAMHDALESPLDTAGRDQTSRPRVPEAAWREFGPQLAGVTLRDVATDGDEVRTELPGRGLLDWPALVAELAVAPLWEIDPRGASTVEAPPVLEWLRGLLTPPADDPVFPNLG